VDLVNFSSNDTENPHSRIIC